MPESINRKNFQSIDVKSGGQPQSVNVGSVTNNMETADGDDVSPMINGIESQITNVEMDDDALTSPHNNQQ